MENISVRQRVKVASVGLLPIFTIVGFLFAANFLGFPFFRILTERVNPDPSGFRIATKVLGIEVSSRPATAADLKIHQGVDRFFVWGATIFIAAAGTLGLLMLFAAIRPKPNYLLQWASKRLGF
jgi:hypothetical protein